MGKRLFDITCSLAGLLLFSPVFLITAIFIKLDSRGPIFYRGVRIGRNNKPFKIFKFRSMVVDAEKKGASSTNTNDVRVTRIGKFIRRFKLDEFTQLINVVKGDMSLVGPRPEVLKFVDMYTEEEKIILSVRPGITDWSSIKFHNEPEITEASGIKDADEAYEKLIRPDKLKLQIKYIKERNILIDINIIICTIISIITTRFGGNPVGVPKNY